MINFLLSYCAVINNSIIICKLIVILPALHESDWQIPNYYSAKFSCCPVTAIWSKPKFIHVVRVALCQLNMTSLAKQFTDHQITSTMKLEKLSTDVCCINSLNHWPNAIVTTKRPLKTRDNNRSLSSHNCQRPAHMSMTSQQVTVLKSSGAVTE